jgi:hypothetical protein
LDPARTGCQKILAQHITYGKSYLYKSILQGSGILESDAAGKETHMQESVGSE